MHSMTAATAADTPPDPGATAWVGHAFASLWNWGSETIPGGNLTMLAAVWALASLADRKGKSTPGARGQGFLKTAWGVVRSLWGGLVTLATSVWAIARFYGGRELRGGPRTDAGFLRAGTRSLKPDTVQAPAAQLGSVAWVPPRVSLVKKPPPRPWARDAGRWIASYRGKGATALDRATRTLLWCVRAAGAVYRFTAPIVTGLAWALRRWHYWPYAARGLARLALTAALVGLLVPAWRLATIGALVLALALSCGLARRHQPKKPGDDATYGPRIWVVLRDDLGLPEDEPRQNWLQLPESLAASDARIVVRLPWTWRGGEMDRQNLTALINSRIPGEWVARVSLTGETYTAVYTHKPAPKPPAPTPECPEGVSFFDPDIQEAIANCKKGQIIVGKDAFGRIIMKEMGTSETPHWALSVGTGGGKSSFCQMVIAQLIAQGYYIVGVDVKRVSVTNFKDVVGCYIYNDPMNVWDMRQAIKWFSEELSARSAIAEADPTAEFPGILCLIEESNEFADISKEWWDENRKPTSDKFGPADPAADPTWGDIASAARVGRHVYGNILAVFQDLRDQALGGKGIRNLFRLKYMGNYSVQSWKNVIGTTPVPESVDKAGRMMIVEGNQQYWIQTPFAKPEELRAWAIQARERTGFTEGAGLFGTPPTASPKRLPRLLERLSRDELPEALRGASEGGQSEETAGRGVTPPGSVTDDVTASRDRLRLVPGQGAPEGSEGSLEAPRLLTIAELAREMQARGYEIEAALMRQHKKRRETTGFPEGITIDGAEKFTLTQLIAFYEKRGIERRKDDVEETEQGDAV
ncbi:hypothetical protein ACFY9Y_35120 [Streptomyces fimicarius]|uniref:hypothetical protein n=1 Tax=Streptomyces griseus TaxID=1911 RepID=UPI0036EB9324